MPSDEEFEELKGRLVELENRLKQGDTARAKDVSDDEMKAFLKVRDVLSQDFGEFCGINDCFRCIIARCVSSCITRCVTACVVECSCGPCIQGPIGGGGAVGRFGSLGG